MDWVTLLSFVVSENVSNLIVAEALDDGSETVGSETVIEWPLFSLALSYKHPTANTIASTSAMRAMSRSADVTAYHGVSCSHILHVGVATVGVAIGHVFSNLHSVMLFSL